MEDYLRFEPSKLELYDIDDEDKYYLFQGDNILVNLNGGYTLPNREYIIRKNLNIKFLECVGAYNQENCYLGMLDKDFECEEYKLIPLREFVERTEDENQLLVASRAYMLKNHRFNNQKCGRCGSDTKPIEHGEDRAIVCTNCGHTVWPTNSTAIIVAVIKDDKILLAHNNGFKKGMYSVLAGFVEMGETFEECVRREVLEETGIKVKNIRYFASQPWAFPNNMMTAFVADYDSGEIKVDGDELSHADWFTKEEAKDLYINSISVGSELINWFIDEY